MTGTLELIKKKKENSLIDGWRTTLKVSTYATAKMKEKRPELQREREKKHKRHLNLQTLTLEETRIEKGRKYVKPRNA